MSTLYTNNIRAAVGNTISVPSSHTLHAHGITLQVLQTVKTDTFASTIGGVWGDIPGLSVSITPKYSTSKILVMFDVKISGYEGLSVARTRLLRDSTAVYIGDAADNRPQASGAQAYYTTEPDAIHYAAASVGIFLDSPSTTSQVTYKMQLGADGTSQTVYVNRTQADRNNTYFDSRMPSSITVMEIAQ